MPADSYLLQIQEYVAPAATPSPAPTQPPKPTDETKPTTSTNTADSANANTNATTTTNTSESVLKWYDVEVVKGTQFTVTAYQVPVEEPVPTADQQNVNYTNCRFVHVHILYVADRMCISCMPYRMHDTAN